jgi:D-serine deaminase-like pyridoxal phosphate-dependent protein
MSHRYLLEDVTSIHSPCLLFFKDLIQRNIQRAIEIAGDPNRLRPHVKTHKTREIVRMELTAGIRKHKCATIAEAEMLAETGVTDVLLAYPLVGPNCARLAQLIEAFPNSRFAVLADHPRSVHALSDAMTRHHQSVDVLVDVNSGQNRTGVAPGPGAEKLYDLIAELPGLEPGGLHFYDGHHRQQNFDERRTAALASLQPLLALRKTILGRGLPIPRLIIGGTPTFPVHAQLDLPNLECAPGTFVLHDYGYATGFPDLDGFTSAAVVLTRVVSRPTADRVTLDVGTKAMASDPPVDRRCVLLDVPDCEFVAHNEEHLVVRTPAAGNFTPGDVVYAIPSHICPTCALYRVAHVVENGRVTGEWEIAARDRILRF